MTTQKPAAKTGTPSNAAPVSQEYADTAATSPQPLAEATATKPTATEPTATEPTTTAADDTATPASESAPRTARLSPAGVAASITAAIPASVRERLPEVHMATLNLPFHLPSVAIPTIDRSTLPKVELPKVVFPHFEFPAVHLPKVDLPTVDLPTAESVRASAKVVADQASAFGRGVTQAVGIAREVVGLGERTPV